MEQSITPGSRVIYAAAFGAGPRQAATVRQIDICAPGAKEGTPVARISASFLAQRRDEVHAVLDLDDGHWCYGSQVLAVLPPAP
jgi:hypothetical protein